jgi:hypothetical protein
MSTDDHDTSYGPDTWAGRLARDAAEQHARHRCADPGTYPWLARHIGAAVRARFTPSGRRRARLFATLEGEHGRSAGRDIPCDASETELTSQLYWAREAAAISDHAALWADADPDPAAEPVDYELLDRDPYDTLPAHGGRYVATEGRYEFDVWGPAASAADTAHVSEGHQPAPAQAADPWRPTTAEPHQAAARARPGQPDAGQPGERSGLTDAQRQYATHAVQQLAAVLFDLPHATSGDTASASRPGSAPAADRGLIPVAGDRAEQVYEPLAWHRVRVVAPNGSSLTRRYLAHGAAEAIAEGEREWISLAPASVRAARIDYVGPVEDDTLGADGHTWSPATTAAGPDDSPAGAADPWRPGTAEPWQPTEQTVSADGHPAPGTAPVEGDPRAAAEVAFDRMYALYEATESRSPAGDPARPAPDDPLWIDYQAATEEYNRLATQVPLSRDAQDWAGSDAAQFAYRAAAGRGDPWRPPTAEPAQSLHRSVASVSVSASGQHPGSPDVDDTAREEFLRAREDIRRVEPDMDPQRLTAEAGRRVARQVDEWHGVTTAGHPGRDAHYRAAAAAILQRDHGVTLDEDASTNEVMDELARHDARTATAQGSAITEAGNRRIAELDLWNPATEPAPTDATSLSGQDGLPTDSTPTPRESTSAGQGPPPDAALSATAAAVQRIDAALAAEQAAHHRDRAEREAHWHAADQATAAESDATANASGPEVAGGEELSR